jgi:hypothetical protein
MAEPGPPDALSASGAAADRDFPSTSAGDPVLACQTKTWIAIELKDKKGRPVVGEPYRIELPDGRVVEGTLDAVGCGGVDHIDPGTCSLSFPRLDGRAWNRP